MAQKDKLKLALAVVMLLTGIGIFVAYGGGNQRRGQPAPENHYFYDLQSGDLFPAPADVVAPIDAPSGGEGVRAFVYTCGECTQDELIVGYLRKRDQQAADALGKVEQLSEDESSESLYAAIQQGTFVAPKPEAGQSPQWVNVGRPEGQQVSQVFRTLCNGKLARICEPDDVQ